MRPPDIGVLISAWAEGKEVKVKGEEGEWHPMTPDSIHGITSDKEWVTLREAIKRYDEKHHD